MNSPDERFRDQATATGQSLLPEEKGHKQPDVEVTAQHDTVPKIRGWPQEATPLPDHIHGLLGFFETVTDILLLVLPACFVGKSLLSPTQ